MQLHIPQQIIQILLFEGSALKKQDIAKILKIEIKEIDENVEEILLMLEVLGLKLIQNQNSLEIALHENINSLINKNKIQELQSELSESSLQTLAVIMYKIKATKAEVDFIRGVDSGRSIKNLLTRGLIEKCEEKNKKYYIITTESLKYLNLENVEKVKDFEDISQKLKVLIEGE